MTFSDLARGVFGLYRQGAYVAALELIEAEAKHFPDHGEPLAFFRICLLSRAGRLDEAMATLSRALDQGYAYSSSQLHEDDDLSSLRLRPEFGKLASEAARRYVDRCPPPPPFSLLAPQRPGKPAGLVVALHGNHATAANSERWWRAATDHGWSVCLPESAERDADGPVWNDRTIASRDLAAQLEGLRHERVILAGFSRGAEQALWLALTGVIPAIGCIAVAPSPNPPEFYARAIADGRERDLRVSFLLGGQDASYLQSGLALAAALEDGGVVCEGVTIPDMGHAFPPDFGSSHLVRALDFVAR
jgi:predicted esterase